MTPVAIARTALLRVVRDRTALFFMVALPILVILIIGGTVRGFSTIRVGVVDLGSGRSGADLSAALGRSPNLRVSNYPTVDSATRAVAQGEISSAVVLPLIVVWALVGAGAGMLSGTLFRTPEQATAIGPAVGMALAMLGGCMWPLSIVNSVMRQVGHAAPQAWAVDAWTAVLARGGSLLTISLQLVVLTGFAAAFLILATLRMRRALR